jgi:hypothetical protein
MHFARMSCINVLGCWTHHFPSHFALPNPRAVHLVTSRWAQWTRHRRHWNVIDVGDSITASAIANAAEHLLSPPRYLPQSTAEARARDTLLAHLITLCRGTGGKYCEFVDRHTSFAKLLSHPLLRAAEAPRLVETGTIRAEEDWAAGYSTYLFGAYLGGRGSGSLDSVDLSPANCDFARRWTQPFPHVRVHCSDSIEFLRHCAAQSIDVLYLDSMDTEHAEHAQHCLREWEVAQSALTQNALILIDDTVHTPHGWIGKGALTVPAAISAGWRIEATGYQVLIAR